LRTAVEVLKKLVYEKNSIIYQLECNYNNLRSRCLGSRPGPSRGTEESGTPRGPEPPDIGARYSSLLKKYNTLKKRLLARELSTGKLLQSIAGNQRAAEASAEKPLSDQPSALPDSAIQTQYEALQALYASATRTIQAQGERIAELTASQGTSGPGSLGQPLEPQSSVLDEAPKQGEMEPTGGHAESVEAAGSNIEPPQEVESSPEASEGAAHQTDQQLLHYIEETCRDFNSVILVNRLPRDLLIPYSVLQNLRTNRECLDRILLGTRLRGIISFLRGSSAKPTEGAQ